MESATVVKIDATETNKTLDALILKAEYLKSLLQEIDGIQNLDEETELAELLQPQLPKIVYTIGLGQLKEVMNAPQEAFSKAFLDKIGDDFKQIANTEIMTPEKIAENKGNMAMAHINRQKMKRN